MAFGKEFFSWFRAAIEIIKVLAKIFGDESDQEELKKNGFLGPDDSAH